MNEDLPPKATITGKRQITIPKEICEILNIEQGDKVIFKKEGDKIIFGAEGIKCFACNGTKKVGENECFLCGGKGELVPRISKDFINIIGQISINSLKYGVAIIFSSQELDKEGMFVKYKEIPIVTLRSENYPKDDLIRIQDEIQKLVIEHFCPRSIENENLFCLPSDGMLNIILDTLTTKNAKEEVRKWFRYERTDWKFNE